MAHRLRCAMAQGPLMGLMHGQVEADETYVGGRKRGKRGRPGIDSNKTPVVALVERGTGRVRAIPVPRVTSENLEAVIAEHVRRDATLMTDEYQATIKPVR